VQESNRARAQGRKSATEQERKERKRETRLKAMADDVENFFLVRVIGAHVERRDGEGRRRGLRKELDERHGTRMDEDGRWLVGDMRWNG
jgi:hypothetical protein